MNCTTCGNPTNPEDLEASLYHGRLYCPACSAALTREIVLPETGRNTFGLSGTYHAVELDRRDGRTRFPTAGDDTTLDPTIKVIEDEL